MSGNLNTAAYIAQQRSAAADVASNQAAIGARNRRAVTLGAWDDADRIGRGRLAMSGEAAVYRSGGFEGSDVSSQVGGIMSALGLDEGSIRSRQRSQAEDYRQQYYSHVRNARQAEDYRRTFQGTVDAFRRQDVDSAIGGYRQEYRQHMANVRQADDYRQTFQTTVEAFKRQDADAAVSGYRYEYQQHMRGVRAADDYRSEFHATRQRLERDAAQSADYAFEERFAGASQFRQRGMLQRRLAGLTPDNADGTYSAQRAGQRARLQQQIRQTPGSLLSNIGGGAGTGVFLNVMFGAMEVNQAMNAIQTGRVQGYFAGSMVEQADLSMQALDQASGGMLGSMQVLGREMLDWKAWMLYGGSADTHAKVRGDILTSKGIAASQDVAVQAFREHGLFQGVRNAYGSGFAMRQASMQAESLSRQLTLRDKANSIESLIRSTPNMPADVAAARRSEVAGINQSIETEKLKASLADRQMLDEQQMRAATLSVAADGRGDLGLSMVGRARRRMIRGHDLAIHKMGYDDPGLVNLLRDANSAELAEFDEGNRFAGSLSRKVYDGAHRSSGLRLSGRFRDAELSDIATEKVREVTLARRERGERAAIDVGRAYDDKYLETVDSFGREDREIGFTLRRRNASLSLRSRAFGANRDALLARADALDLETDFLKEAAGVWHRTQNRELTAEVLNSGVLAARTRMAERLEGIGTFEGGINRTNATGAGATDISTSLKELQAAVQRLTAELVNTRVNGGGGLLITP
jgi:hypothetical protein